MAIKIIELDSLEISQLAHVASLAAKQGRRLRLAESGDGIMVKVGEGMWTHPLGYLDPDSDYVYAQREVQAGAGIFDLA